MLTKSKKCGLVKKVLRSRSVPEAIAIADQQY